MVKRYIKDAMRAPFGGYDFIKREIDTLRAAEHGAKFSGTIAQNKKITAEADTSNSDNKSKKLSE